MYEGHAHSDRQATKTDPALYVHAVDLYFIIITIHFKARAEPNSFQLGADR
jgi:hypothetical protein